MPVQTFLGYGYELGGPGDWRFHGFSPGDPLCTEWFDERNPMHDFADTATKYLTGGVIGGKPDRALFNRIVSGMPFHFRGDRTHRIARRYVACPPRSGHPRLGRQRRTRRLRDPHVGSECDIIVDAALAELGLRSRDPRPKWLTWQGGRDD